MPVKVRFLSPFKEAVGEDEISFRPLSRKLDVEGLMMELCSKYPKLRSLVFNEDEEVDYSVNAILNGVPLSDIKKNIKDGDELTLFIPLSGG